MPKRSNEFQHLVALIEKAMRPHGAKVAESRELIDHVTNEKREVDVVIELVDGIHTMMIGVECKGGGEKPRRATVEWVEQMWGKHLTLPTDTLILVSKAGFSSSAKKKAAFWNIRTLSLSQAENSDWPSVIRELNAIKQVSFLRPYPTRVTVVIGIGPDEDESDLVKVDLPNAKLYDEASSKVTTLWTLVEEWLNDPAFLREIEKLAYTDSGTIIEFERRLRSGVYLVDDTGARKAVVAIGVEAKCKKEVSTVEMIQSSYGNAVIAHGRGASFGRQTQFLAIQQPCREPQLTVSVKMQRPDKSSAVEP